MPITDWWPYPPQTRSGYGAPVFADVWFDSGYPYGRGLPSMPPRQGWICSGCRHGYSPATAECPRCPETSPAEPESCCGPAGCEEAER